MTDEVDRESELAGILWRYMDLLREGKAPPAAEFLEEHRAHAEELEPILQSLVAIRREAASYPGDSTDDSRVWDRFREVLGSDGGKPAGAPSRRAVRILRWVAPLAAAAAVLVVVTVGMRNRALRESFGASEREMQGLLVKALADTEAANLAELEAAFKQHEAVAREAKASVLRVKGRRGLIRTLDSLMAAGGDAQRGGDRTEARRNYELVVDKAREALRTDGFSWYRDRLALAATRLAGISRGFDGDPDAAAEHLAVARAEEATLTNVDVLAYMYMESSGIASLAARALPPKEGYARLEAVLGDLDRLRVVKALKGPDQLADYHNTMGVYYALRFDIEERPEDLKEAASNYRTSLDLLSAQVALAPRKKSKAYAWALHNLGVTELGWAQIAAREGDKEVAADHRQKGKDLIQRSLAEKMARLEGPPNGQSRRREVRPYSGLVVLADIDMLEDNYGQAEERLREALGYAVEDGSLLRQLVCQTSLENLYALAGDTAKHRLASEAADKLTEELRRRSPIGDVLADKIRHRRAGPAGSPRRSGLRMLTYLRGIPISSGA